MRNYEHPTPARRPSHRTETTVADDNVTGIYPAPSTPNPLTENRWEWMPDEELTRQIAAAAARVDAATHTYRALLRELTRRWHVPTDSVKT